MEKEMKCPKCDGEMEWLVVDKVKKCNNCGYEYVLIDKDKEEFKKELELEAQQVERWEREELKEEIPYTNDVYQESG